MTTAKPGDYVTLKPERADAYGLGREEVYRVALAYRINGYKALWLELDGGEMVAPYNKVKASECNPATASERVRALRLATL